jgi:hypothetical protein
VSDCGATDSRLPLSLAQMLTLRKVQRVSGVAVGPSWASILPSSIQFFFYYLLFSDFLFAKFIYFIFKFSSVALVAGSQFLPALHLFPYVDRPSLKFDVLSP